MIATPLFFFLTFPTFVKNRRLWESENPLVQNQGNFSCLIAQGLENLPLRKRAQVFKICKGNNPWAKRQQKSTCQVFSEVRMKSQVIERKWKTKNEEKNIHPFIDWTASIPVRSEPTSYQGKTEAAFLHHPPTLPEVKVNSLTLRATQLGISLFCN